MSQVVLKPRKARPFYGRHPWVLDTAIDRVDGSPADGDEVDLVTDKGKFIARGVYNGHSRIRVRLYTWEADQRLDEAFWARRLRAAVRLREQLGYLGPQGAARLVYSEGDLLSGLIVDRFDEYLVVQVTSLAMARRLDLLTGLLRELVQPKGILLRADRDVTRAEGVEVAIGPYWGQTPDGPVLVAVEGLRYLVDLVEGQKTGFYLDQRKNRHAAAGYLAGRRVLDLFCYTGGFSLAAAQGGAQDVLGVDGSRKAVALAEEHARLNGLANVRFEAGDVFRKLDGFATAGERFGAVVLDPPKFARSRGTVDEALRAYHRVNRLAVEILEPGGILVTCSCSGHVTREDFFLMLMGVAQQTGREIQVLEQRGASPDHPVAITAPESEYLKCFLCRVL